MNKKVFKLFLLAPLLFCSCKNKESDTHDAEGNVLLHTKVQRAFLNDKLGNVNLYARGVEELSRPLNPTFTWNGGNNKHTVYLSESKDYDNPTIYEVSKSEVSFQNLKINTPYYFKVESSGVSVHEESFTTSREIIRNIYISGVTNARDLGGYRTDNKILKQGLIYRTAKLNKNSKETPENVITEKGINTMLNVLKVKSEIDLRGVENNEVGGLSEGVGVLGESVKYYQCPMDYTNITDEVNTSSLIKVFSILGNKDNYPTFFHCSIGTDRTGYIAWLINAYLGISEENLYRDYLFSNFGSIGGKRTIESISGGYVAEIKNTAGDTLSEKTKNFLINKGVSEQDLNTLKEMMI